MILGKYAFGDNVLIDTQNGGSEFDVYLHEITHYSITQGSICGNLMIALNAISELREYKLKPILSELHQSSIITQEMTAMYVQAIYERMTKNDSIADKFKSCLSSSDYYKKFCLDGFDALISYPEYVINNQLLLIELATISLNFDITENEDICYTDPLSFRRIIMNNPSKYNADYRYKKLVNAAVQLINHNDTLSIDNIIELAGIEYINNNYQVVKDSVFRLCECLCAAFSLDFDDLINNVIKLRSEEDVLCDTLEGVNIEKIKQRFVPRALNYSVKFPPEGTVPLLNNYVHTVMVLLHDKQMSNVGISDKDVLILHHSFTKWHYAVPTKRDDAIKYVNQFPGEIICFLEDHQEFSTQFPIPQSRRVFYYFEGQLESFFEYIESKSIKNIHAHQVNDDVYCVFATQKGREVFFTLQTKFVWKHIIDSINSERFTYINLPEGQNIDNCFYLNDNDWCKYEDVLSSIVDADPDNSTEGFLQIGHRIYLQ